MKRMMAKATGLVLRILGVCFALFSVVMAAGAIATGGVVAGITISCLVVIPCGITAWWLYTRGKRLWDAHPMLQPTMPIAVANPIGLSIDQNEIASIRAMPLVNQCKSLGIPFSRLRLPGEGRVETLAARHLEIGGCRTSHCEGGSVLIMLKAMALHTLTSLNGGRLDSTCNHFLEGQMVTLASHRDRILRAMRQSNASSVYKNAKCILKHHPGEFYPRVQADFVRGLFETLGPVRWTDVADAMFDAPYEYRKGWPDLAVIDAGKPRFVEVKGRDRLHASQIITIHRMRLVLGDVFEVVQVSA